MDGTWNKGKWETLGTEAEMCGVVFNILDVVTFPGVGGMPREKGYIEGILKINGHLTFAVRNGHEIKLILAHYCKKIKKAG